MKSLTDQSYWNGVYSRRDELPSLQTAGFKNHITRLVLDKLTAAGMDNKRVLEIGAGDSVWLTYLAKHFPSSTFCGLDYSAEGCARLADRANREKAKIEIFREDMFVKDSQCHGSFDVVYSLGVVE